MDLDKDLKALGHHAYCLIGSDEARSGLLSFLKKKQSLEPAGNPDFFDRAYENFTIDDARELKAAHATRPTSDKGKKIFVISMNGITVEAQNALLKLLEEPAPYAHFFLIIPSRHLLLPTVRSRLYFLQSNGKEAAPGARSSHAKKFLAAAPAKRLELVKSLLDEIGKEKKTKQDAIDFINDIEAELYGHGIKKTAGKIRAVETASKYLHDRSPSLKMLLEYVALSV